MPLGIIEILQRVGEDKVKVQFLASDMTNIQLARKGLESLVTFATDPGIMSPSDLVAAHTRNVGIVCWMPRELVEKARMDYAAKSSMTPDKCQHKDFTANVNVARLEDSGRFQADVRIVCTECNQPFRFIGLPAGLDLNGAATSADATEARLAIGPKGEVASLCDGAPMGFSIRGTAPGIVDMINELRVEEGSSIEILSVNPEAETSDEQEAIEVYGSWTNWNERRFYGRTLAAALANAVQSMKGTAS